MLRIIAIAFCGLYFGGASDFALAQRTGDAEKDAELADRQVKKSGNVLRIADNAPDRYVVVKGDTLWDIASKYLLDPWRWPELWRGNRDQIKDPHWIYPGDVLVLDRKSGTLSLERGATARLAENKLSPTIRAEALEKAVPVIPANIIEPYLSRPHVIESSEFGGKINEQDVLRDAPQIVGGKEGRTLLSAGDFAYVSGIKSDKLDWNVFRPGKVLKDPATGEILGAEAIYLGRAKVTRRGEPAEIRLGRVKLEVLKGDRLVPEERVPVKNFVLKGPGRAIEARVISIYGGVDTGGPHSIVAINRGRRDGLEGGDVLALFRSTRQLEFRPHEGGQPVTLQPPDDRYGLVTVFRVGDRISYALVMDAGRELSVGDTLRNP